MSITSEGGAEMTTQHSESKRYVQVFSYGYDSLYFAPKDKRYNKEQYEIDLFDIDNTLTLPELLNRELPTLRSSILSVLLNYKQIAPQEKYDIADAIIVLFSKEGKFLMQVLVV